MCPSVTTTTPVPVATAVSSCAPVPPPSPGRSGLPAPRPPRPRARWAGAARRANPARAGPPGARSAGSGAAGPDSPTRGAVPRRRSTARRGADRSVRTARRAPRAARPRSRAPSASRTAPQPGVRRDAGRRRRRPPGERSQLVVRGGRVRSETEPHDQRTGPRPDPPRRADPRRRLRHLAVRGDAAYRAVRDALEAGLPARRHRHDVRQRGRGRPRAAGQRDAPRRRVRHHQAAAGARRPGPRARGPSLAALGIDARRPVADPLAAGSRGRSAGRGRSSWRPATRA